MRRIFAVGAVAVGVLLASPARADIALTIDNGRVTLVAKDATISQILAEWARVGQTRIVNAERLTGPPVTLELNGVPEETALGILLRSASGYLLGLRAAGEPNGSRFSRILIMPTSVAPRPTAPPAAAPPAQFGQPPFPQPAFPQPAFPQPLLAPPPPSDDGIQDQDPGQREQPVSPNPRGPVFQTFPIPPNATQPQPTPPVSPAQNVPALTTPPAGSPTPTVPIGVAVPGMPVPVPTPQQPAQAPQPNRRPGV